VRTDLDEVRNFISSFSSYSAMEIRKTLTGLGLELTIVFDHIKKNHNDELVSNRIKLSDAHSKELKFLESKYIEQIKAMSKAHTIEIEKMHQEVMFKAERVIKMSRDQENNSFLSNISHVSDTNNISLSRENFESTSIEKTGDSSYSDNIVIGNSNKIHLLKVAAFESVVKGIMTALISFNILNDQNSMDLVALANAHQEPSIAATAAAKSILSGHLERFYSNND
jgi:hypothetical protein